MTARFDSIKSIAVAALLLGAMATGPPSWPREQRDAFAQRATSAHQWIYPSSLSAVGGYWHLVDRWNEDYALVGNGQWGTNEEDCRLRKAVCHDNGQQIIEAESAPNVNTEKVWLSDTAGNSSNYVWYGPFLPKPGIDRYLACFVFKDATPGVETANVTMDILDGNTVIQSVNGYLIAEFNNIYRLSCFEIGSFNIPPGLYQALQLRFMVNNVGSFTSGQVKIDRVDLFQWVRSVESP